MKLREMARWVVGAAAAAGAIAWSVRDASADHRLVVAVDNIQGCGSSDNGASYVWGEDWGLDINGNTQCQVMTANGTAMAQCPMAATQHYARVDARSAGRLTGVVYAPLGAMQTTWTSADSQVGATFDCSGIQTTVYAEGIGEEVP
jgi:hypothetical protein